VKPVKILAVDDEPQIRRLLHRSLRGYGYEVLAASTGTEALQLTAEAHPDLVVLDISLGSYPDGLEVCYRIREFSQVPIIILSVHDEKQLKLTALDTGADDFITKPFDMEELEARIRAIRRRIIISETRSSTEIKVDALCIDLARQRVFVRDEEIRLTPTEYELLRYLAVYHGRVLTYPTLLEHVWGKDHGKPDHHLRVFINTLRKKLNGEYIITIPGIGYRFVDVQTSNILPH
jgi:two-component system, OmpR family, KDP operon response regulator KdpE